MNIDTLLGMTLAQVTSRAKGGEDDDEVRFFTDTGRQFKLYHEQDCCESVGIEEVVGDLQDLVGSPITQAEESSNEKEVEDSHQTWTFYRLATAKGAVVLRWLGESNGYYSESVDFEEIIQEGVVQ